MEDSRSKGGKKIVWARTGGPKNLNGEGEGREQNSYMEGKTTTGTKLTGGYGSRHTRRSGKDYPSKIQNRGRWRGIWGGYNQGKKIREKVVWQDEKERKTQGNQVQKKDQNPA